MRIPILCMLVLTLFTPCSNAMLLAGPATSQPGQSSSNGFFGGITGGHLRLLQSDIWGGPLYYGITPGLTVSYLGKSIALGELPLKTPITVTIVGGSVSSVTVAGGDR